ncbi:hypothetical protein IW262DRAFT_1409001 [Armillaria fumosa]|nr:hypothetical protein IW262DRAFT_1409001 [Armillaria fumosa]
MMRDRARGTEFLLISALRAISTLDTTYLSICGKQWSKYQYLPPRCITMKLILRALTLVNQPFRTQTEQERKETTGMIPRA